MTVLNPPAAAALVNTDVAELLSVISPIAGDLGVGRGINGADLQLLLGFGGSRYWQTLFKSETGNPGGFALTQVRGHAEVIPLLSKPFGDASVVLAGVWTEGANAEAYEGKYKYATALAAKATITTPSCNRIGIRVAGLTNGGLARVAIDADFTKANLLPTAAQVVAAGTYPNTILVANGGTCAPTDRVLDTRGPTAPDTPVAIADERSLAAAIHTVELIPVEVVRTVGAGNRVYFSGYSYGTKGTTILTTPATVMHSVSNLQSNLASALEYAIRTGGTFFGSVHGFERQTRISISVDGVAAAVPTGECLRVANEVTITRTSELLNPAEPAEVLALATVVYTLTRSGLKVSPRISWRVNLTETAAYSMFPLNGVKRGIAEGGTFPGPSQADVVFSAAELADNGAGPYAFTGVGDTYFGKLKSLAAWMMGISPATAVGYVGVAWLESAGDFLANWKYSANNYAAVEDRGSLSPPVSKIYFGRSWEVAEEIKAGDVWSWTTNYMIGRLPGGVAALTNY